MGRLVPGRNGRRADRLTVALALGALATAGTVMANEVVRLARRRGSATRAPQDTVTVLVEGYEATPRSETVLFNMLSGFVFAFALIRVSTAGIRKGWRPFADIRFRGRHIHHFVPGILLAFSAGATALVADDPGLEEKLAVPFGAGIGLTFDEAALLLDFKDVYWTREGVLSVQLSLGLAATLGGTILALRMLRRGEERVEAAGLIPAQ